MVSQSFVFRTRLMTSAACSWFSAAEKSPLACIYVAICAISDVFGSYFTHHGRLINVDFRIVVALFRLGHKYCIYDVLEEAAACLMRHYTTDFDAWTAIATGKQSTFLQTASRDAITVIRLARLAELPALLPSAFLVCTTLGPELFREGLLSPGDLSRIMNGKARLERLAAEHLLAAFQCLLDCEVECETGVDADALVDLLRDRNFDASGKFLKLSPLLKGAVWKDQFISADQDTEDDDEESWLVCDSCAMRFEEEMERRARTTWAELPYIFDVEVVEWPQAPQVAKD